MAASQPIVASARTIAKEIPKGSPMPFEENVWKHYQGDDGIEDTVNKLLREYEIPIEFWDELYSVFQDAVRRVIRGSARTAEHRIIEQVGHFTLAPRGERPAAVRRIDLKGAQPIDVQWEKLLDSTVSLSDGRRKRWRDLTVKEHRDRIALLQKNVDGLSRTISLHEHAIEWITLNKKKTLGDLAPVA
jgi:hypothetical protein